MEVAWYFWKAFTMKVMYEKGDRKRAKELGEGILLIHVHNVNGTAITLDGIYSQAILDETMKTVTKLLKENSGK